MKTYSLSPIASRIAAAETLDTCCQDIASRGYSKTRVEMRWLDEVDQPGVLTVSADISGRHYNCDSEVVSVLERLRDRVGGEITNDA